MILEIYELTTNSGVDALSQTLTNESAITVNALRPHLYISGPPAGSLYMEILNSSSTVIATSETVAISSITSSLFFHGYVRFYIDAILAADTEYSFALRSSGGYTFQESAFVGWCSDYDLRKYTLGSGLSANPMDLEIWSLNLVTRGTYP